MFATDGAPVRFDADGDHYDRVLRRVGADNAGRGSENYRAAADASRAALRTAGATDTELAAIIDGARREHRDARDPLLA